MMHGLAWSLRVSDLFPWGQILADFADGAQSRPAAVTQAEAGLMALI